MRAEEEGRPRRELLSVFGLVRGRTVNSGWRALCERPRPFAQNSNDLT